MFPTKQLEEELFLDKVRAARGMQPSDKLLAGPRLFDRYCRLAAAGLRHRFPDADEISILKMLQEQLDTLRKLEASS